MPIAYQDTGISNIVISNGGINPWAFIVEANDGTVLGTVTNGGAYSDGSTVTSQGIRVKVDGDPNPFDGDDTTEIAITGDNVNVTIKLQTDIADNSTPYYVDTNGVLYTDSSLTTPFHAQDVTEETIDTIEPKIQIENNYETDEVINVTEDTETDDGEASTLETLGLEESHSVVEFQESKEIVRIIESHVDRLDDAWTERSESDSTWSERSE